MTTNELYQYLKTLKEKSGNAELSIIDIANELTDNFHITKKRKPMN